MVYTHNLHDIARPALIVYDIIPCNQGQAYMHASNLTFLLGCALIM